MNTTRGLIDKWQITAVITALLSLTPYTQWLSLLSMTFLTLATGYRIGSWFLLAALLPPLLLTTLMHHSVDTLFILSTIFIWLAAVILWRYRSWSSVLDYCVAVLLIGVTLLAWLFYPIDETGLQFIYWLINSVSNTLTSSTMVQSFSDTVPLVPLWLSFTDFLRNISFFDFFPRIFTSIVVVCCFLNPLSYVFLAQVLLPTSHAQPPLPEQLRAIRLHGILTIPFLLIVLGAQIDLPFALQLVYGMAFLYGLAGLSLYHWLCQRLRPILSWLAVIVLYLIFFIYPLHTAFTIISLACIDSLLSIRQLVKNATMYNLR